MPFVCNPSRHIFSGITCTNWAWEDWFQLLIFLYVKWAAKKQKCLISLDASLRPPSLCLYLSELKLEAVTMTSSLFWTNTGIFLQPGDFNNLCNNFSVSAETHRDKTSQNTDIILNVSFSKHKQRPTTYYTTASQRIGFMECILYNNETGENLT